MAFGVNKMMTKMPCLLFSPWQHLKVTPSINVNVRRAFSTDYSNQSRGGLPRFFSETLPSSKGGVVRVQGDEFWHINKVLRLSVNDRIELFNGKGCLVEGCIENVDRTGLQFVAIKDSIVVHPREPQWDVFAAFGTLKGGRADWLVEKCTELGANSITPLLTERSPSISENRVDRLQRVILAATKQCQRLHEMTLNPSMKIHSVAPMECNPHLWSSGNSLYALNIKARPCTSDPLCGSRSMGFATQSPPWVIRKQPLCRRLRTSDPLPHYLREPYGTGVARSKLSFVAAAEAAPVISILKSSVLEARGNLIIGPEGDFTKEELKMIREAGATAVGLGPHRLRVETATIALLATLTMWSES